MLIAPPQFAFCSDASNDFITLQAEYKITIDVHKHKLSKCSTIIFLLSLVLNSFLNKKNSLACNGDTCRVLKGLSVAILFTMPYSRKVQHGARIISFSGPSVRPHPSSQSAFPPFGRLVRSPKFFHSFD